MAATQQESCSSKFYQSGTIPSPRTGHSLTMISNELAVLFGGITLDKREHGVEHVFQQTCRDGSFCLLNMDGYTWLSLSGKIAPGAYHTAVFRFKRNTLYIIGGVQLQDDNAVEYCSIQEITAVQLT